ncbi:MAG: hypothetical protein ABI639_10325 [Thermoanaerobaculia bacterium]
MSHDLVCEAPAEEVQRAIEAWMELAGGHVRVLLISAFGDIYFEATGTGVAVVDTWGLEVRRIAESVEEFERRLEDDDWRRGILVEELVVLAGERGLVRGAGEIFAVAPHPCFTDKVVVDELRVMGLAAWHSVCVQVRAVAAAGVPGDA